MKLAYSLNQYCQQRQTQKPVWVYPVLMAMQAQYYKQQCHDVYWDIDINNKQLLVHLIPDMILTKPQDIDFLKLPAPDRVWTRAKDPRYQRYGNYKHLPATHMQAADGCWWGKCAFCVENKKPYKIRDIYSVIDEIKDCEHQGFREVFDDSGTFPTGKWLEQFCVKKACIAPNIVMGCNMRVCDVDFDLMKSANFRMLLFGIESASQRILNQINKGVDVERVIPTLKKAVRAGLEPHGAFMFGYPGASEKEEIETLRFVHYLLRKGLLHTAQASVYRVEGYKGKDKGYVNKIYNAAYSFEFWFRKLSRLRNLDDMAYLIKQIRKGIVRD